MKQSSHLEVRLYDGEAQVGGGHGLCQAGVYRSERVFINDARQGRGNCNLLYGYYLWCVAHLDCVREFSSTMYSEEQGKICSCIMGSLRRIFDAESRIELYRTGRIHVSGAQTRELIEEAQTRDYRNFCRKKATTEEFSEMEVFARPPPRQPRFVASFPRLPQEVGMYFTSYFVYTGVFAEALLHDQRTCSVGLATGTKEPFIFSRMLRNFDTMGSVFSTPRLMILNEWPVCKRKGELSKSDLKFGYQLLKKQFEKVCQANTARCVSVDDVEAWGVAPEKDFIVQLKTLRSAPWPDAYDLVVRALTQAFGKKRGSLLSVDCISCEIAVTYTSGGACSRT